MGILSLFWLVWHAHKQCMFALVGVSLWQWEVGERQYVVVEACQKLGAFRL